MRPLQCALIGDNLNAVLLELGTRLALRLGGEAVIPSNVKVGPPGTVLDVPLGHKDNPWSFDHFDTMTVCINDSPRPREIMVVMALADGGRINPRCGQGPVTA